MSLLLIQCMNVTARIGPLIGPSTWPGLFTQSTCTSSSVWLSNWIPRFKSLTVLLPIAFACLGFGGTFNSFYKLNYFSTVCPHRQIIDKEEFCVTGL